jgi:signal transduction histidine kinase
MTVSAAGAPSGFVTGPGPRWLPVAVQTGLAGLLGLVVLPVGWTAVWDGDSGPVWTSALLVALVVLHVSVLGARRWPVPTYAVGAFAELLLVLGPDLAGPVASAAGRAYAPVLLPSSLCFFVLVYAVSAHAPRPWPFAALAVGLVGCLLTVVRLWGFSLPGIAPWAWLLMVFTAAVAGTLASWALGRFRATRDAWIGELAERGAADERRRIAREMHDVVAHSLAVVVSHAEAGRLVVGREPERAPQILDTIAETGRGALAEMRGLLGVLRDGSAPNAPQPGLGDLPDLVGRMRSAGLDVTYDDSGLPSRSSERVSATVGLTAYRVVQEALTNVSRHAGPDTCAAVSVSGTPGGLVVEVTDDGTATAGSGGTGGRGLSGMRERVEAVGGALTAGPGADRGWRVHARLPWGGGDV